MVYKITFHKQMFGRQQTRESHCTSTPGSWAACQLGLFVFRAEFISLFWLLYTQGYPLISLCFFTVQSLSLLLCQQYKANVSPLRVCSVYCLQCSKWKHHLALSILWTVAATWKSHLIGGWLCYHGNYLMVTTISITKRNVITRAQ